MGKCIGQGEVSGNDLVADLGEQREVRQLEQVEEGGSACTSTFQEPHTGHKMGVVGPSGNMVGSIAAEISQWSLNHEGPHILDL